MARVDRGIWDPHVKPTRVSSTKRRAEFWLVKKHWRHRNRLEARDCRCYFSEERPEIHLLFAGYGTGRSQENRIFRFLKIHLKKWLFTQIKKFFCQSSLHEIWDQMGKSKFWWYGHIKLFRMTSFNCLSSWKDVWSKGINSHIENSPSFQMSWIWSDVYWINDNCIHRLQCLLDEMAKVENLVTKLRNVIFTPLLAKYSVISRAFQPIRMSKSYIHLRNLYMY